jgi:ligand-binding sensor domain-containing protein
MKPRPSFFLPLALLLLCACTMACAGPPPTAAPAFTRFSERLDLLAIAPDGSLWLGSADGIAHYDGQRWTEHTRRNGLVRGRITALAAAPDGTVWAAGGEEISRYDGRRWRTQR